MDNNKSILSEENLTSPLGPGQNSFSVPPSYFDELPVKIMDRIHSGSKQEKQFFMLKPSFTIASLVVLSGIIILLLFIKKDAIPFEIQLSENEIAHIVENPELYNISEDAITERYLSSNSSYEFIDNEPILSDDEIKTFLEENSEASNIINEY